MLQKVRTHMHSEEGFSLIELLIVVLIIGILAAIALPAFLSQQTKGQDSSAKSEVRNNVSQIESCFADAETYANCPGTGETGTTDDYSTTAVSRSTNTFTITKTDGATARSCVATGSDKGGCSQVGTGTW